MERKPVKKPRIGLYSMGLKHYWGQFPGLEERMKGYGAFIAAKLEELTGQEARVTVPGHYQRGGPPCPYDRVLATQFGAAAAELIEKRQYGRMVAIQNGQIVSIPLEDAASRTKFLPTDHPMIKVARDIGISFGD